MLDMSPWLWWLFLTCPPDDGNDYFWRHVPLPMMTIFDISPSLNKICVVLGPCQLEGMWVLRGGRNIIWGEHTSQNSMLGKGNKSWGKLTSPPVPLPLIPPPLPLPPPWKSTCKLIEIKWSGRIEVRSKNIWRFKSRLNLSSAPHCSLGSTLLSRDQG